MGPGYLPGAQRHVKEKTSTSLPPIMTPRPPPDDVQHFSPAPPHGARRGRPRPGGKMGSQLKLGAAPALPLVHSSQASEVTPAMLASMQGSGLLYFDSTGKKSTSRDASPSPDSAAAATRYPSKAGGTLRSQALASTPRDTVGYAFKPPQKDLRLLRPKPPEQTQKSFAAGSNAGDAGSSLYGHSWRTADAPQTARVKPSAHQADKVYSNPVVPGAPRVRRPRRQFVRSVLQRAASPQAWVDGSIREKVLGVLAHALTAESLQADVQNRIIQSVSNALLVDESETSAAETSALGAQNPMIEPDAEPEMALEASTSEDLGNAGNIQASENSVKVTNQAPAVDIDLHELRAASATPALSVADSVPVSCVMSIGSAAADDLAIAAVVGAAAEAIKVHAAAPSRLSYFSAEAASFAHCESSAAADRIVLDTVYAAVAKALEASPSKVVSSVAHGSSAAADDLAVGTESGAVGDAMDAHWAQSRFSVDTQVSVQTVEGASFEEEVEDDAMFQLSATVLAKVMDASASVPDAPSDVAVANLSEDVSSLALDSGLEAFLAEMAGDISKDPVECVDLDC